MKELTEAFRKLKSRDVDTFPGVVLSVDKTKGTCKIESDGLEYLNVQLSSINDGSNKKLYLFPAVGSSVLVSPIGEDIHRLYVESYGELESMDLKIGNMRFQADANGFLLKKENETLKALMQDLIIAIKAMKFTTNNGPTINLINLPDFVAVENRFNQFLKDS